MIEFDVRWGRIAYIAALMLATSYLYDFWAAVLVFAATADLYKAPE